MTEFNRLKSQASSRLLWPPRSPVPVTASPWEVSDGKAHLKEVDEWETRTRTLNPSPELELRLSIYPSITRGQIPLIGGG